MLLPMPKTAFESGDGEKLIEAEITRRSFKPKRLYVPSHQAIDFEILSIKTSRKISEGFDGEKGARWHDEELLVGEGSVSAVVFAEHVTLIPFEVEPLRKGDKISVLVKKTHSELSGTRYFTTTWDGV